MAASSILLGDDLTNHSKRGLQRSKLLQKLAGEMARRMNSSLTILDALDVPKKVLKQEDLINPITAKEISRFPIKTKLNFLEGSPVELLLREDRKQGGPELLVIGSRGNKGIKRAFLGSVSEEVLRNAKHPVLVLGPVAQDRNFTLNEDKALRVVVMTDLSPASGPAERYALTLAKRLKAEIMLIHSVGDQILHYKNMLYSQRVVNPGLEKMFDQMIVDADKTLSKKIQAYQAQGVKADGMLLTKEKSVAKVVSDEAEKYDLVIMGTHGRNKFLSSFLGSSARDMILKSPVPVIVVRSKS